MIICESGSKIPTSPIPRISLQKAILTMAQKSAPKAAPKAPRNPKGKGKETVDTVDAVDTDHPMGDDEQPIQVSKTQTWTQMFYKPGRTASKGAGKVNRRYRGWC